MSDQWDAFDNLARRHLQDGRTVDEALEAVRKSLGRFAPTDGDEARQRIAAIREALPPERTEAETWAMLDDALARLERRPEDARHAALALEPEAEPAPEPIGNEYLSLAEIEAQRHELARAGKPHGYKMLAAQFGKTARSTIRRRYKGLPPPGSPIPGVCQKAPPHQHHGD